jgi:hypothetical protein
MNYKRKRDAKARAELPLSENLEGDVVVETKKEEVEVNADGNVKKSHNSNGRRGRRAS